MDGYVDRLVCAWMGGWIGGLVLHPQVWSDPFPLCDWTCECYIWHLFSKERLDCCVTFEIHEAEFSSCINWVLKLSSQVGRAAVPLLSAQWGLTTTSALYHRI